MKKLKCFQSILAAILTLAVGWGQDGKRGIVNPAMAQQNRAENIRKQVANPRLTSADGPAKARIAVAPTDPVLGMNLWHMRLADAASPVKIRGLQHKTQDKTGTRDWTPERMTLGDAILEDELLRLSFESASVGYLYVIDRDVYKDGTKSTTTLRFPTKQLRGGDNLVGPGEPIQIPSSKDNPPAFTVVLTRKDQTGIQVTLILSPKPLPEIVVPTKESPLSEALVAKYEQQFGTGVQMVEDKSMVKLVSTLAENTAASDPSKPLGDKDPLPITLFHRAGHPGDSILATALIKVKAR